VNDDAAFLAQYDAATQRMTRVRFNEWTAVRLVGKDRASFLHNMCTNDIRGLAPNGQCEAFLTDVKGKIVAHVVAFVDGESLLLLAVPGQGEAIIKHLDRYIITEDVRLIDETSSAAWVLCVGPLAGRLAEGGLPGHPLKSTLFFALCQQVWTGGFWARGPMDASDPRAERVEFCSDAVWHTLRIESGWPLFGVDFDESNLPQEVGRIAEAINFRKGCYLGQETIARIDALGHVNRQIATVKFDSAEPPAVGTELLSSGQSVGRVTSACWSPTLSAPIGLAMVKRGFLEPGTRLECAGRGAEVISTPAVPFHAADQ
jgi:folate-binding protein YgfZ